MNLLNYGIYLDCTHRIYESRMTANLPETQQKN